MLELPSIISPPDLSFPAPARSSIPSIFLRHGFHLAQKINQPAAMPHSPANCVSEYLFYHPYADAAAVTGKGRTAFCVGLHHFLTVI